jgi:dolichol-phosphate mannosyltransferase
MLTTAALFLFGVSVILMVAQLVLKLVFPGLAPKGFASVLLLILFFGSSNLLAIGVVGEYLAKIFEEVKQRPHFIRRSVIRDGEIRLTAQEQKRRQ